MTGDARDGLPGSCFALGIVFSNLVCNILTEIPITKIQAKSLGSRGGLRNFLSFLAECFAIPGMRVVWFGRVDPLGKGFPIG